jgi:hypothetical protein
MADSALGPPSDQRIAVVFKFPFNLLGSNFPMLNWMKFLKFSKELPILD